ncbi:MAG: membrane-bound ClpP family serine protease [Limisphaerales bacterium]|jgi:membrane-bound ClpP family serine protease
MALSWIILIILVGLFCLFTEFFFFPGTTAAGIMGIICLVTGISLGYREFGYSTGNILFISSTIMTGVIFWFGFKSLSSKKYAVHETISSRVNEIEDQSIKAGVKGSAVSALRPGGTALINDNRVEVFTRGEFIDSGTAISVIKLDGNKIMVEEDKTDTG